MLDTKALADATAMIVREHVAAAVEPLLQRIAALEAREMVLPEKGDKGEPGEPGSDGVDGAPGEPGRDGKDGVGIAGFIVNREGEAVATLSDGTLHNLGRIVGLDGKDGEPGRDGVDGRDGNDLTDIEVTQEGATIEFAFQIGETRSIYEVTLPEGPPGADGQDAYPGMAKGLYDPNEQYRANDCVSFNGCEWRAKVDAPGDLPGPDWMMSAQKGKRGDRGEKGQPGRDGLTPIAQYLRGSELVTTMSDGVEIKADLSELREQD